MYRVLYMELEILDLKFSMLHRTQFSGVNGQKLVVNQDHFKMQLTLNKNLNGKSVIIGWLSR